MGERFQRFLIKDHLSKTLIEKLYHIPNGMRLEGHPLLPYVKKELIPKSIDLIILPNFDNFVISLLDTPDDYVYEASYSGLYLSPSQKTYKNDVQLLKQQYGLTIDKAVFLKLSRPRYPTLIHEILHYTFDELSKEAKEKIFSAGVSCKYKLFGCLTEKNLLHALNEHIACFFTNFNSGERLEKMPSNLKQVLQDIGYNMINPPELNK